MKKCFTTLKLICLLVCIMNLQTHAQVTIGSNIPTNNGSLLDLKQLNNLGENSTKGLGLSRVSLEAINLLAPCVPTAELTPEANQYHTGLVVYNVTNKPEIGLCPGVHVWDSERWVRLPKPCDGLDPALLNSPNCFIVAPNGGVSEEIPVGKPYILWPLRPDLGTFDPTGKVSLSVLWQDTPNLIDVVEFVDGDKGGFSKFRVKTKSGSPEGNALVAVHIGSTGDPLQDPVRWSWHIWVTAYNPNSGTTYTNNNGEKEYVFMDRNVGALSTTPTNPNSMGLMYQWGRKDPFPAAKDNFSVEVRPLYSHPLNADLSELNEVENNDGVVLPSGNGIRHSFATATTGGSSNLQVSIEKPMEFLGGPYIQYGYDTPFDWYSGSQTAANADNQLWDVAGKKSPFDPCPGGWRVPANSATKSPWYPYVYMDDPFDDAPGISRAGDNGYNINGDGTKPALGYYPSSFIRAHRAFLGNGFVGNQDEFPNFMTGLFNGRFESINGMLRHVAHYWSASFSDNVNAKIWHLTIGPMEGNTQAEETVIPKSSGAFVRCVKE